MEKHTETCLYVHPIHKKLGYLIFINRGSTINMHAAVSHFSP